MLQMLQLLLLAGANGGKTVNAARPPFFRAVSASDSGFGAHDNGTVVIGQQQASGLGILGLEGSFYTRTNDGVYHFLSGGRMSAPTGWNYWETDVHMRFDHWQSLDGTSNWTWTSKVYESSGVFDGTDRRGSTWAPMATYDAAGERWHLFYVAYRASPAYRTPLGLYRNPDTNKPQALHYYTQFDGEIFHSISTVKGEGGISGPYRDVGAVLDQEDLGGFSPSKDGWEGDHGCDMFFPFKLANGTWLALYGSEFGRFPNFELRRQVGLARFEPSTIPADRCALVKQFSSEACVLGKTFGCHVGNQTLWARGCRGEFQCGSATVTCDNSSNHGFCEQSCDQGMFAGTWTRLSALNPLDSGFRPASPGIENPVVVRTSDGAWWVAVYTICEGSASVGVSWSRDGVTWTPQRGDVQLGNAFCGDTVTTACGLVAEPSKGKGVYSLLYTALGACSSGTCSSENVCRAYLINTAEQQLDA